MDFQHRIPFSLPPTLYHISTTHDPSSIVSLKISIVTFPPTVVETSFPSLRAYPPHPLRGILPTSPPLSPVL